MAGFQIWGLDFTLWPCCAAGGILVFGPGVELAPRCIGGEESESLAHQGSPLILGLEVRQGVGVLVPTCYLYNLGNVSSAFHL